MVSAPRIELATRADVAALATLRQAQGWSRSEDLLEALVAWSGGRVFIIRERSLSGTAGGAGERVAVATVASVAPPLGVIGSVMTRVEFQRRGLGRSIMEHALGWQMDAGARTVSLDATPAGRPLYRGLGFVEVASSQYTRAPLASLDRAALHALASAAPGAVIAADAEALPALASLDRVAYGGNRLGLLDHLLHMPGHSLLMAQAADGAPAGYLMTRPPEEPLTGVRIGPLVARDDATAAALLEAALDRAGTPPRGALVATIAGENREALSLFASFGAIPIEDDIIMRAELPANPDIPAAAPVSDDGLHARVYCWLAPMVF